ncbi:MAG: hypothetical protein JWO02_399 [Solirubrobacterales bacterium]|nr:hypothetical protein [Solirubrobacterales bacterium]
MSVIQQRERDARSAWRRVADVATAQRGLIDARQLLECGVSDAQRRHAVATARLHLRHRRVYSVGHRHTTTEGRLLAALLDVGSDAVLAGRPSLVFWGLLKGGSSGDRIEVLAPTHRRSSRGVTVSRRPFDPRRDVRHRRGVAALSPLAAIADAAGRLPASLVAAVIEEAAVKGWLHAGATRELLRRVSGRPGARVVRAALGALDPSKGRTRSQLERAFERFCRRHGLPSGKQGVLIDIGDGELREMDVWFAGARVVVELDGLRFHERGTATVRDRRRDRRLLAAGVRTVRVTWDDLDNFETELADDLRRTLGGV